MIIPVRCVTCGKVIGDKWRWFERKLDEEGPTTDEAKSKKARLMDELGLKRMCCRRHMLTTVDVMDKI
jgi:DNA-directed RNA polymerase subunit N (RpoN/RPB10)